MQNRGCSLFPSEKQVDQRPRVNYGGKRVMLLMCRCSSGLGRVIHDLTGSGHFNPKEDPGEKEKLRLDMVAREKARQKKADAAIKEYEGTRTKQVKLLVFQHEETDVQVAYPVDPYQNDWSNCRD